MTTQNNKPAEPTLDARVAALRPVVRDVEAKLVERVVNQAKTSGWSEADAAHMGDMARAPFFDLMSQGVPAPSAYLEAYFYAEKLVAKAEIEKAVSDGVGAEKAFAEIAYRKRQGRNEVESPASQAATTAFGEAIANKSSVEDALLLAYDAAARAFMNEAEATMPDAA